MNESEVEYPFKVWCAGQSTICKRCKCAKNCGEICTVETFNLNFSSECLPPAFPPQQVPFFQLQNKVLLPGLYSPLCPTTLQGLLENHYPSSFGPFILLHSAATGTLIGSGMPDVSLEKRLTTTVGFFLELGKMLRFSVF